MISHSSVIFLLLSLLNLEVNSVLTPNPTFNMANAATLANNLLKIYDHVKQDNSNIIKILNKMSIEISTLLYNSADSIIHLKKYEKTLSLPYNFHAPNYIRNGLEQIDMGIKRVNRLFRPFFDQYLNQNISIISLKAIMVKALDLNSNAPRDSVQRIYHQIHLEPNSTEGFFSQLIEYLNTNLFPFCFFMNPRYYMVKLYENIVTMELRMFVMSTFGYKLQCILTNSNCTQDLERLKNEHLERRRNYIAEMQKALSQESNEFFHCNPIYDTDYTPDQVFAVNLLLKESDYQNNWVVTGIKFVVKNKILHLQLEESKLVSGGQIDPGSEQWIPVDDMDYDSATFTQSNYKVPLRDDIESHYIGLWDYLHYSTLKAPENFVVVGAKFEIHYLYPGDYLNKTIIYLQLKYVEMNSTLGQINSANVKFSDILSEKESELKRRFQQFNVGTDRDEQYVNIGYAGFRITNSSTVLTHIDPRPVNLPLRTPLTGIGLYENNLFERKKAASLKIFVSNETPFFDYSGLFFDHRANEREKLYICDLCNLK